MADEQYLKQHLHAIEEHMRFAIADLVRAKPAEPLAGLLRRWSAKGQLRGS